ncbi:MAG TPA: hypothetical protein VEC95_04715 [Terriglobales bacterium]|nr:hypothetical protein [Terriglobales bacterium]
MKKILALSALIALLAIGLLAKDQRWTGFVSDAKCGAKVDAACAKKCIEAGEKVVFVNDGDKVVIPVANPDALKQYAGQHVLVEGKLENNQLTVSRAKVVNEAKKVIDATY